MEHSEIYTLDQYSPYPKVASEKRLRRRTIDLRPDMDRMKKTCSWFKLVRKNKPQQKSIAGGLIEQFDTDSFRILMNWAIGRWGYLFKILFRFQD